MVNILTTFLMSMLIITDYLKRWNCSFSIVCRYCLINLATVLVTLNPFLASSTEGCSNSDHGSFPYFFHATYMPLTNPGTITDEPPDGGSF